MPEYDLNKSPRDRIRYLMDSHGFANPYALERATGLKRSTIKNILSKDTIGPRAARKIAEAFDLSVAWVESGFGPISRKGPDPSTIDVVPREAMEALDAPELDKDLLPVSQRLEFGEFVFVPKTKPMLSTAGRLIPVDRESTTRFAFRADWLRRVATDAKNVVLMDVQGDSMLGELQPGEMVLLDTGSTEIVPGETYAIASRDSINIKKIEPLSTGRIRIISTNSAYPPYEVDLEELRIIGRLIWSARTRVQTR